MATRRQHIRNSRTVLEAGTPLEAEYPYDQTLKALRVGDGATPGGLLQKRWGYAYVVSPSQIVADQNDYNPTDLTIAELLELTSDAKRTITGLGGGALGRRLTIRNRGTFDITLSTTSTASLAANRFLFERDLVLRPRGSVELQYSVSDGRWMRAAGNEKLAYITEELLLTGAISPGQLTANQNDYAPTGIALATTLRLSSDASRNITGIADARDGVVKVIVNVGTSPIVLKNNDTGSNTVNRFDFGSDVTLAGKQSATIRYDSTDSRWKLLSATAGASVAAGAVIAQTLAGSALGPLSGLINGKIVESRASGAVTFAIKTLSGGDPSPSDPVIVSIQDGSGSYAARSITSALALTVSSGSSLGGTSGVPLRIWIAVVDTGSGCVIGAVNCVSGSSVMSITDGVPYSTTAEGGAGGADFAQTIYTSAAQASKFLSLVAYADYDAGLAMAGTWNVAPSRIVLVGPATPRPGWPTGNRVRSANGGAASGTTVLPCDNSIPQSTEGTQLFQATITPMSPCNLARVTSNIWMSASTVVFIGAALFRDSGASALAAVVGIEGSATSYWCQLLQLSHLVQFGSGGAATFKVRAGPDSAATIYMNATQAGPVQVFGGVSNSFLDVEEVMG